MNDRLDISEIFLKVPQNPTKKNQNSNWYEIIYSRDILVAVTSKCDVKRNWDIGKQCSPKSDAAKHTRLVNVSLHNVFFLFFFFLFFFL